MYATLKMIHVTAAILTISGFMLRGFWMFSGSAMLARPLVRVAPHIIDTVFLLSGIGLIVALHLPVMTQAWLLAKFAALILYIVFGAIALRPERPMPVKAIAFMLAVVTFAYIVGVALSKSVLAGF